MHLSRWRNGDPLCSCLRYLFAEKKTLFIPASLKLARIIFCRKRLGLLETPLWESTASANLNTMDRFCKNWATNMDGVAETWLTFMARTSCLRKDFFPTFFQTRSGFYERLTNLYFHIREYKYILKVVSGIVKFNPLTDVSQRTYL